MHRFLSLRGNRFQPCSLYESVNSWTLGIPAGGGNTECLHRETHAFSLLTIIIVSPGVAVVAAVGYATEEDGHRVLDASQVCRAGFLSAVSYSCHTVRQALPATARKLPALIQFKSEQEDRFLN